MFKFRFKLKEKIYDERIYVSYRNKEYDISPYQAYVVVYKFLFWNVIKILDNKVSNPVYNYEYLHNDYCKFARKIIKQKFMIENNFENVEENFFESALRQISKRYEELPRK